MKVELFVNPQEFKEKVSNFLMQDEVVNNLPLGIINGLVDSPQDESFMAMVSEAGAIQLVMVKTTSHLVLSTTPEITSVRSAVEYLLNNNIYVPSVIGPKEVADEFVRLWEEKGLNWKIDMGQRIYVLERVNSVPMPPGRIRTADEKDIDLVTQWIFEFGAEALEAINHHRARTLAETSIAQGTIYIWQDGEPVTMAKKTRPTENGIVVNLVYTPPKFRRKGYATACVAALSQRLLDDGYSYCSLYTDLANPTSNKIYMQIGYKPVADSVVYKLD